MSSDHEYLTESEARRLVRAMPRRVLDALEAVLMVWAPTVAGWRTGAAVVSLCTGIGGTVVSAVGAEAEGGWFGTSAPSHEGNREGGPR